MTYRTVLGDTWDIIAKKVYGNEFCADKLMDVNRDLLNQFIFSEGVEVSCPELPMQTAEHPSGWPEWRT